MTVFQAKLNALVAVYSGASERELAATLLSSIAISGALVGLLTYVLPHPPGTDFVLPTIAFTVSIIAGLALLRYRRTAPWWAIGFVVALGSGVITVTMLSVPDRTGVYAPYYVLIAIFSFYFLRPRHAIAQLGLIGILYAVATAIDGAPGAAEIWANGVGIALLVGLLVLALRVRIEGLVATLELTAETDVLTDLANRRGFDRRIETSIEVARARSEPLALVLIDLDRFKQVNDSLGHLAGDAALARIGKLLPEAVRDDDRVYRFGGDEFALILPRADRATAETIADRVVTAIADAFAGEQAQLTASVGVALLVEDEDSTGLIASADARLYASKRRAGGLEDTVQRARYEHQIGHSG